MSATTTEKNPNNLKLRSTLTALGMLPVLILLGNRLPCAQWPLPERQQPVDRDAAGIDQYRACRWHDIRHSDRWHRSVGRLDPGSVGDGRRDRVAVSRYRHARHSRQRLRSVWHVGSSMALSSPSSSCRHSSSPWARSPRSAALRDCWATTPRSSTRTYHSISSETAASLAFHGWRSSLLRQSWSPGSSSSAPFSAHGSTRSAAMSKPHG
jgi:hypothetical protein